MLYLHIGTPKAGSSTIQTFLSECRDTLPYRQVDAFGAGNCWRLTASTDTAASRYYWINTAKAFDAKQYAEFCSGFWDEVRREVAAGSSADFIASGELLYEHLNGEREAVKQLQRNLVSVFGDVKILIYFRNQIDFVKSYYSQSVKGLRRSTLSLHEFVTNLEALKIPIHYGNQFQIWGDAFGWNNIDATVFDRRNFRNGNLIEDFCSRTGIAYDGERFRISQGTRNISPSYGHLAILRHVNRVQFLRGRSRRVAKRTLRALPLDRDFPSHYDAQLVSMVSEENCWLNNTFFADLPVKLPVESHSAGAE